MPKVMDPHLEFIVETTLQALGDGRREVRVTASLFLKLVLGIDPDLDLSGPGNVTLGEMFINAIDRQMKGQNWVTKSEGNSL